MASPLATLSRGDAAGGRAQHGCGACCPLHVANMTCGDAAWWHVNYVKVLFAMMWAGGEEL